jgi:hypothetical protein
MRVISKTFPTILFILMLAIASQAQALENLTILFTADVRGEVDPCG